MIAIAVAQELEHIVEELVFFSVVLSFVGDCHV